MISAHCTNAATKPDTLYYVLWRKKHESPLTGKSPNQINLQQSTYSLFHCQWLEKVKASTWLSWWTTKKAKENLALLLPFFFLTFSFLFLLEQSLGLVIPGSFAGLEYGILILQTALIQDTNSLLKCSLPLPLPQTGIQAHSPRISFSCCSLSSLLVRYGCQM